MFCWCVRVATPDAPHSAGYGARPRLLERSPSTAPSHRSRTTFLFALFAAAFNLTK